MSTLASPAAAPAARKVSRGLSAIEFLVGAAIVIAHNVYHLVPNEVPILFVVGWMSIRLRDGGWKAIGLKRPASWMWTVGIALAAAIVRLLLGELVIVPLASHLWPEPVGPAIIEQSSRGLSQALLALGLVWTFAVFGEEMGYRGYLLTRAADLGGRSSVAYWAALIPVSVLFGYGHFYKGYAGVVDSAFAGLVLGGAYLLSRRNFWVPILAHGFIDSIAIAFTYLGWSS
jgi:membrane protease YdiL (CAAX protease family)